MNIEIIRQKYIELGYTRPTAIAKVCQDVILNLISKSTYFKNVTIKGGVVMYNLKNYSEIIVEDLMNGVLNSMPGICTCQKSWAHRC